jgi:L-alanine-DL-glutamate epimerase-like enolase superfamily enzyme
MRIIRVTSTALARPSPGCLLELETDEGLTGVGIGSADAGAAAEELGREALIDEDPRAVVALWQKLLLRKPADRAIALLDIALWDLKAKANQEPLWKALGGARPRANAYASVDGLSLDDEQLIERFSELAEQHGFGEGKLSVGLNTASDMRRLGLVRDALRKTSAYPVLMIDAGDRWTADQAISNINELEKEFDLTWVESSDGAWDQKDLRQVSDSVFAAVCADSFPSSNRRAADIVQVDLQTSGITGSMRIADAAYGFELPVTLNASPGNIAAHLAAALPNIMSMEVREPAASDGTFSSGVVIENGRAVAGDRPGHGLLKDAA